MTSPQNKTSDDAMRRTSKFLSLVLRHRPEEIGLELDEHGWAGIDELIDATNRESSVTVDRALIERVVAANAKQRFAISEDGRRIRANQGHSIDVDLDLETRKPPARLFHGTATRFLESIRTDGLVSGSRQHVHLSEDQSVAVEVGRRHGRPAVLLVDAAAMHAAGWSFHISVNGVWLTDHVPVEFLQLEA